MSRKTRRVAIASLALGFGLAGPVAAGAKAGPALGDILSLTGVGGVADELPVITGDVESGLADLLSGDGALLGGVLGLTGGVLNEVLGGLGSGLGDGLGADLGTGLGTVLEPDLSIQPVPTVGGEDMLEAPRVGAGLLDNLLGLGSITESLAGRL